MTPEINYLNEKANKIKQNGNCMAVEITNLRESKELHIFKNEDIEKKLIEFISMFDEHLVSKTNKSIAITKIYEIEKLVTPNGIINF